MKMMNNYLLCEVKEETEKTSSFTVKNVDQFVKVKVIQSSEEDIPVGCVVKISASAGLADEDGLTIRRTDVINIV